MSEIAGHLVRRAVDVAVKYNATNPDDAYDTIGKMPGWGIALLVFTGLVYMALAWSVSYTYGSVVSLLAMVESPSTTAYLEVDSDRTEPPPYKDSPSDNKQETERPVQLDGLVVQNKPITSKLRTAAVHLTRIGGRLARFRGAHIAIITHVVKNILRGALRHVLPFRPANYYWGHPLASLVAVLLVAPLSMTWTHVVISMPSAQPWWRRIPPWQAVKQTLVPTAIREVAVKLCVIAPGAVLFLASQHKQVHSHPDEPAQINIKPTLAILFLTGLTALLTAILILLPAEITLRRVQASLLPASHTAIVPFDRTFNGKASSSEGQAISMLDAWRTFIPAQRKRLLKIYIKVGMIHVFAALTTLALLVTELVWIMGGVGTEKLMGMMPPEVRERFLAARPSSERGDGVVPPL